MLVIGLFQWVDNDLHVRAERVDGGRQGGVFAHAKARALLEVVRLAFEEGIGFEAEFLSPGSATVQGDAEGPDNDGLSFPKSKNGKELAQHPAHPPHRSSGTGNSSRLVAGGPCMWCSVTATPQWRRPRGTNKLLCNACGIFFTRYGKLPERSHHIHAAANQTPIAAVAVAPPAHPGMPSSVPAVKEPYPLQSQGDVDQAEPAHNWPAEIDATDAGGWNLHEQVKAESQQKAVQRETVSSRTGGISSQTRSSAHKRKGAPQLESELLPCMERSTSVDMDTKASPAPSEPPVAASLPVRATSPMHALSAHSGLSRLVMQSAAPAGAASVSVSGRITTPAGSTAAAAAAAIMERPVSTLINVAPLVLGLQKISQRQHLGLLDPSITGLGALSSLPSYLQGPGSAAPVIQGKSSPADVVRGLGHPGFVQSHGLGRAATTLTLPPKLRPRPLLLPNAALAAPPPRPSYVRPSKRHWRPLAGESDDSNVSTDSHAAMNGDPGTPHDDDEGGTATAGPNFTNITTTSGSASSATVGTLGRLSYSPLTPPAGAHSLSAILARPGMAVPSTLVAAAADGVNTGSDGNPLLPPPLASEAIALQPLLAGAGPDPLSAAQLLLPQPQAVLLRARKSKGPRGHAASATPSSSTQS
ncbi:hypothetical protein VaNZ11_013157 [Volvox africanus]|uniref:GATA-type domain-containing protein n=1 Tax=Volvox africanus TaxID=51714 RepID=A0ABQ5SFQ7_9CHLO|nr:hypothetical protein VaNZ11_013157 [Volvox africanus]